MNVAEPDSTETQHLLEQIRAGEPTAFDRLFAQHRDYLRRVIAMRLDHRIGRRIDASDVVQETHLAAAKRIEEYLKQPPMPFRLWLRKTACERLFKLHRRHLTTQKRSVQREVPLPDRSSLLLARQLIAKGPTPSESVVRRDMASCIRRALAQLDDVDREIVLMLDMEGLSSQEAGCILNIGGSTIRRRHARILKQLHDILRDEGLTESCS